MAVDIECLDCGNLRASLISTVGNHCEVWRTSQRERSGEEAVSYLELVIKLPRLNNSERESQMLVRQYRLLKDTLEDIVPEALFVITRINGVPNVCVLAEAVNVWFNIANPQNEEEAIQLLRNNPKAQIQLRRFVNVARSWRQADNPKMIDLFGLDNLIMDINREIRYLDSFYVFFFEDMLHLFDEPDAELEAKIERSAARLDYLENILEASLAQG